MTALLDAGPGAVLSWHTALGLWDVPGFRIEPIHVSHPRGGLRRNDLVSVMHTSRRLPPHHIAILDGMPITTPARSLFDVAGSIHPRKLEKALDNTWSRRLTTRPQLLAMRRELARRGRPGLQAMTDLLDVRGEGYVAPASNLEARFHALVAEDGQPPLDRQVDQGDSEWIARVDAVDKLARVTFEIDSDRFHTALSDRAHDAAREARLIAAGFDVVRFTEHQVWHEGRYVQEVTWAARQAGRRRHGEAPAIRRYRTSA